MKPIVYEFMKATYPQALSPSPQEQGETQPPLELDLPENAQLVALPAPAELNIPEINLRKAVDDRKSVRRYTKQALTMEELSYLLWLTQGVKEVSGRPVTMRTVPSAGARHAFETYLLVNNINDCEAGLYQFAASRHALARLTAPLDIHEQITQACFNQKQVRSSAVTFIWVAVMQRMAWRYVERGYRYLHLDAGHVCQNLYLAAEAVQCGVCAIAAFDDEMINNSLGLDGQNLFVIYLASVGKKTTGQ